MRTKNRKHRGTQCHIKPRIHTDAVYHAFVWYMSKCIDAPNKTKNMKYMGGIKKMNDEVMKKWNEKVKKLEKHISKEFPKGCFELTSRDCDKCMLSGAETGTKWHYLCDLMNEVREECM